MNNNVTSIGDERQLCLVNLYGGVELTKYGTGRREKKGTPYCSRSTNNSSDKLIVIDAKNLCGHAGLLKSSLKPNRYYIIYPDMIPGDITVGKLRDV